MSFQSPNSAFLTMRYDSWPLDHQSSSELKLSIAFPSIREIVLSYFSQSFFKTICHFFFPDLLLLIHLHIYLIPYFEAKKIAQIERALKKDFPDRSSSSKV